MSQTATATAAENKKQIKTIPSLPHLFAMRTKLLAKAHSAAIIKITDAVSLLGSPHHIKHLPSPALSRIFYGLFSNNFNFIYPSF
jgi:hypothetical protein